MKKYDMCEGVSVCQKSRGYGNLYISCGSMVGDGGAI